MKKNTKNLCLLLSIASMAMVGCDKEENSSSSTPNNSSSPIVSLSTSTSSSISTNSSSSSSSSQLPDAITGKGEKGDPYVIYTRKQFLDFANGYQKGENLKYYKLATDLDLGGVELTPIGSEVNPFYGVFDGNGKKISNFRLPSYSKQVRDYGLFGYAKESYVHHLELEIDYDLTVLGAGTKVNIGGLIGYNENTVISDVKVSGTIDVVSGQNSYAQLVLGGIVGYTDVNSSYYVDATRIESLVDITADLEDAADTTNIAGGIIGAVSTGYGQGIYSISSSLFKGNIRSEDAAGGILGVCTYYVSIVDCYATGGVIETYSEDVSYAGGLMAQSYYETAALNNYVSFDEIKATPAGSSMYDSMAGAIAGYAYENAYEDGVDMLGLTSYKNYYNVGEVSADIVGDKGSSVSSVSKDFFENEVQLSNNWDLSEETPKLKLDVENEDTIIVSLDANYAEGTDSSLSVDFGTYDGEAITQISSASLSRDNHSFNGYFYDENKEAPYCFYAPFMKDTTLYAGWTDLTNLLGTYNYENDIGTSGIWKFTETTFYWIYDLETIVYPYEFDGRYIFIGDSDGIFAGQILYYNEDGTITGYDVYDYSYVYNATKTNTDYEIVDYTGNEILGKWYASNGAVIDLYADGNASGISSTSNVEYTGGYRINGSTVQISVMARLSGTFTYDAEKQVMYSDKHFVSRMPIDAKYNTLDGSVAVYVVGDNQYIILDGTLSNSTVSGSLVDQGEVVIDGVTYVVNGTTLSPKQTEPVTSKTYVDENSNEVILNSDGTGTWNGYDFTWDESTGKMSGFGAFDSKDNQITVNEDGTLTIYVADSYYENVYTGIFSEKVDTPIEPDDGENKDTSIYGTYKDGNDNIVVLNSDGTGTWNGYDFTWDESTGKMSGFGVFDSEDNQITVNEDGTLTIHISGDYGDNVYNGTFTKQ